MKLTDFANFSNERQHDVYVVDVIRFQNRHQRNRTLGSYARYAVFPVADEEFILVQLTPLYTIRRVWVGKRLFTVARLLVVLSQ